MGCGGSICTERPLSAFVLYKQKLCGSEPVKAEDLG